MPAKRCFVVSAAVAVATALGLTIGIGSSRPAHAGWGDQLGLSPYWNWKTIETDHFRVTFPADLEQTAQKSANYLEEAHAVLSPKLYWEPWRKTQILVIDNADLANGLTTPLLRIGIVLWATPPDTWFSTAYYDDWLRLLVFHEYTHFLNMDNVQDFYVPLRYLMGDVFLPNSAWPTWMLEGLAVYMETRYTRAGRGRSPYYDMIVRTAVDENVLDTPSFLTLDKVNGDQPYNPAGETPYLFGYHLIHEAARQPVRGGRTADGGTALEDGEDALGVLSRRSAARLPYFINGNLQNVVGKTWYELWDQWVVRARDRGHEQLARIRTKPMTRLERLTPANGIETIGPTPSPDGKWLAYTHESPDRRSGIYLMNLETRESRKLEDKLAGATAAFTPDSKSLVFSAVERYRLYYQFSDLEAYELESGKFYRITRGLRARDPDISTDGRWITFTLTEGQTTGLAIAPLERDEGGELKLGEIRRLATAAPGKYDRVSTPRFSRDGKRVIYSLHRMGRPSEELMAWDLDAQRAIELVADGKFNRFPAAAPDGSLYFVSDRTGVFNLYRLSPGATEPELATNVASGLLSPSIGPKGEIYAAAYASSGWYVARVSPLERPVNSSEVTLSPLSAPATDDASDDASYDRSKTTLHDASDYSVFPSIWPRQWLLLPEIFPGGAFVQADIAGFDAIDRHSYAASFGYNTQISKFDWAASYSNRQLGPTLTAFAADHTTRFSLDAQGITDYTRRDEYAIQASYPILWTYSSLVPVASVGAERIYNYSRGYDPTHDDLIGSSPFVPTADVSFTFSDTELSRLAVSPETGRVLQAGVRVYQDSTHGLTTWKGVVKDTEYFRLSDHTILSPSIQAAWTSSFSPFYGDANAVVRGRAPGLIPESHTATFDSLRLRGYPGKRFFSRSAAVGALDLRVPIWRIFRGWGTNPVFLDNLYGFAFAESTWFPSAPSVPLLGSAGGGVTLSTEIFLHLPLELTVEYDQGFESEYGGKADFFVAAKIGAIGF